ncbi:MFS transporter [Streptomyces roseoverticillatus]|uniref:MFS transporter n=1 Tax=Streptomyces roseoverticillatus TaxID=66429 RepID=A0ABV3J776_9ACTN
MNPRIYLLALGTFTVGTEGYVIAGVLPDVAHDLHSTVSLCGQMVTVFALVYAIAGPPLIGYFQHVPLKRLLICAAVGFAAANVLAALAPNLATLAVARVLAALGAALFAAPAAAAAAALSKPEELPRAIAVTAGGNAVALTLGAPIGTVIGATLGWRASFGFVTALALATALALLLWLPDVPGSAGATAGRLNLLRRGPVRWGLATTFGLFLAAYTMYTYLSPIAHQATGLGSTGVAALMIVFGAGGFTGGRVIGPVLTRHPLAKVLRTVLVLITVFLGVLTALTAAQIQQSARIIVFPLLFVFGLAWWSGGISQQTRLAALAPQQRSQALGLHFSAQFLGVAVAGALGGATLSTAGATSVPAVAGAISLATLLTVRQVPPPGPHASAAAPSAARDAAAVE